ncbi:DUF5634 family protein [Anaerobacillus sp. HL2]|nr:DUF5634 family protein [Anaerobacillus sp. HL2]
MTKLLTNMLHNYQLEDVGVFEEQGEDDRYYIGYTIRAWKSFYDSSTFFENVEGKIGSPR